MAEREKIIELRIEGKERVAFLAPCLDALGIAHVPDEGNGSGPAITAKMRRGDDERLLLLLDELTDLRMRYLTARQEQVAVQLNLWEGSEELVVT